MKYASLIIALLALAGVVVVFQKVSDLERSQRASPPLVPLQHTADHDAEDVEVAIVMGHIQRFHQKYWLAARAGNATLADLYLHEMEEAMEEIADGAVFDDGVDVSANMRTYGLGVVEHLREVLREKGVQAALAESATLVGSCNSCHAASGHPEIRIREPLRFEIPDQDFNP